MMRDGYVRRAAAALFAMALVSRALAAPTLAITAPRDEQTIHDNRGQVSVSVEVGNRDTAPEDLALQSVLDGEPLHPLHHAGTFTLTGIDRGAHTLQLRLLGRDGQVLARSQTIKFYMWQASRLLPAR